MVNRTIRLIAPLVVLFSSAQAFAVVVNFGGLTQAGTGVNNQGSSYVQDGFTFSAVSGGYGNDLVAWQSGSAHHPVGGPFATSLTSYYAAATVTIARSDAGLFDASSIDLAPWGEGQNPPPTFNVAFTGTKFDNTTVTDTFTVANTTAGNSPVLQTMNFTGFANLKKITVVQGFYAGAGTSWQFNNLNAAPVPEPFTVVLAGCALVAGVARRKRA